VLRMLTLKVAGVKVEQHDLHGPLSIEDKLNE